ncbi:MAG: nucleoside phosphorylase [Thermodesulfobacteriota bacterium]
MTPVENAVISPMAMHKDHVESLAVLVANQGDLSSLCGRMTLSRNEGIGFFMSRLYAGVIENGPARVTVAGPVLGAAYAALLAETLIASGTQKLLFWGWTGSISPDLRTGDILVPDSALADEGVTANYRLPGDGDAGGNPVVPPKADMTRSILSELEKKTDIRFHSGPVWTTDAIFRETPQKIRRFQEQGAVAVEMETSALFSVARFRGVAGAALLTVSDELFTGAWKPGFFDDRFLETRKKMPELIGRICNRL